jgi:hypothetical protein
MDVETVSKGYAVWREKPNKGLKRPGSGWARLDQIGVSLSSRPKLVKRSPEKAFVSSSATYQHQITTRRILDSMLHDESQIARLQMLSQRLAPETSSSAYLHGAAYT